MTLVCAKVQRLPQNATDPPIGNGSLVFCTVPSDETDGNIRYTDNRSVRR
jgi:hypothetical protein